MSNLLKFFSKKSVEEEGGRAGPKLQHSPRKTPRSKMHQEEEDDEDEEFLQHNQSSSAKRRKGKAKSTPRKKAPVTENSAVDTSTEDANPPLVAVGSDFFLKASEKRMRQKQPREQQETADSLLESDSHNAVGSEPRKKSSRRLKEKKEREAKPCKEVPPSENKVPVNKRIMHHKSDIVIDLDNPNEFSMQNMIVNLRKEAKIAAEEEARMSAGKETHPFFSLRKVTRKSEETLESTEVESKRSMLLEGKDVIPDPPPLHVTQISEDETVPLDWKNWIFHEKIIFDSSLNLHKDEDPSLFEGEIVPLKFDSCSVRLNSDAAFFPWKEVSSNKFIGGRSGRLGTTSPHYLLAEGEETYEQFSVQLKIDEKNKDVLIPGHTSSIGSSENRILQERMESHLHCSNSQSDNRLWINKYHPENASEVCGNSEAVRFLSEWLHCWRERDIEICKNPAARSDKQDNDNGWFQSDSDVESMDERDLLNNVFLLTGPVGSGKSAAIYACAKEQGFEVIEVSASDWRNGALVRQKFSGAMESYRFHERSPKDPAGSQGKCDPEYSSPISEKPTIQVYKSEVVKFTPESDMEELKDEIEGSGNVMENKHANNVGATKTLVLFEDVDTIFDEDRGFIATLLQLAETAKRPIILTSNNKDPILPELLDRLAVNFTLPSVDELASHIDMVCAAEDVKVSLEVIRHFVRCCQGDIRKTIMLLQFWCQGGKDQGRETYCMCYPVQFDLDAGHHIMPKIIPWGFPCQLSDRVVKEISKTLCVVKENEQYMEIMNGYEFNNEEELDALATCKNETESIEARKEALLSRNCSVYEDPKHLPAQFDDADDMSDSAGPPVMYARRPLRHKVGKVLSSDTEDELVCDSLPAGSDSFFPVGPSNGLLQDVSSGSLVERLSRIQESNYFVPETRISDEKGLPSVNEEGASLISTKPIKNLPGMEVDSLDNTENMFLHASEVDRESVNGNEDPTNHEVCEARSEHPEVVTRGYPLMDECSRADFRVGFRHRAKSGYLVTANLVQETWKKLQRCHEEYKSYITSEQRDAFRIVKLTTGMTDLISETDMMLCRCESHINDSLEPSMIPDVEPEAICWYDQQLVLASTFAQHGLRFYAKKSSEAGLLLGYKNDMDLAQEMLASSNNPVALGKLMSQKMHHNSCSERNFQVETSSLYNSTGRELESRLSGTLLSMIPTRSYLALRGATFLDYLSYLGQISKSEAVRTSQDIHNVDQRRTRIPRHYLRTGSFALSSDDVLSFAQYSSFCIDDKKQSVPIQADAGTFFINSSR